LFVRQKRHVRVGRFTYKVSVVISGQTGFGLKITLKC